MYVVVSDFGIFIRVSFVVSLHRYYFKIYFNMTIGALPISSPPNLAKTNTKENFLTVYDLAMGVLYCPHSLQLLRFY